MFMNAHNSSRENWEEIRTAYHVARLGTLSAAAVHLGVHHATVIRHVNTLEERLDTKLFHRHPRGYTPTEAGLDLLQVAAATEDQLAQLAGRLRGRSAELSGELIVTTLAYLSPQITPWLVAFQRENPAVQMTLEASDRRLRLEYGEAHVALRAGPKPQEADNVVQKLTRFPNALYAHKDYITNFGILKGEDDIPNHRFITNNQGTARGPSQIWLRDQVPAEAVTFKSSERSLEDAVIAGAGIGFMSVWSGHAHPDLVQMMPARPEWATVIWLVTHVDLHRTEKVQALLSFLKDQVVTPGVGQAGAAR